MQLKGIGLLILAIATAFVFVAQTKLKNNMKAECRPVAHNFTPLGTGHTNPTASVYAFERELNDAQLRQWYARVEGRYSFRQGMVFASGTADGEPLTFERFVQALRMGFRFPELGAPASQAN